MKKGTIHVVEGRQKVGKTETCRIAYGTLRDEYGGHEENQSAVKDRELLGARLRVKSVLVGFMSKSEPVWSSASRYPPLMEVLAELLEAGCKVIVCATHGENLDGSSSKSTAAVDRFIDDKMQGWNVQRHSQDGLADEERIANEIVEDVLRIAGVAPELAEV